MGIISSTFLSLAVRLAWNCQRFLDPRYRYIEPTVSPENLSIPVLHQLISRKNSEKQCSECTMTKQMLLDGVHNNCPHHQNRTRRAAQLRYRRRRRSSFDAALIISSMNKNGIIPYSGHRVISSTPNTLTRQQAPIWSTSLTSSSSSSSSSSSVSSNEASDVNDASEKDDEKLKKNSIEMEIDIDNNDNVSDEKHTMTAAEEAAFRMTIGRGHFSRSKKDKFLNNLRLEKRLNDLNHEYFEPPCRMHSRSLHRYHSGDFKKII